ncbi:MAG: hypothetical protein BM485_14720 [Desulfobulbaceae bacterium DB1]|nr:MAG: hypothetical protein BM485_14720 [Desulfobulbaceae bacterium DB1]
MEKMTITIHGYYHDRFMRPGRPPIDRGWRCNRIMNGCGSLLAALMRGNSGLGGIMYLAMGEGLKAWDGSPPRPDPAATGLVREILRRQITAESIVFLDGADQPSSLPTARLQIDFSFSRDDFAAEGVQPVREFGLFGGNSTNDAGSGLLINHVIHPRIDISAGLTLCRTLRLDFSQGLVPRDSAAGHFGGHLPIRCIDGVGDVYGDALNAEGIITLADLAASALHMEIENIPSAKMMEFRAKAGLVLAIEADLSPLAQMADASVSDILKLDAFSHETTGAGRNAAPGRLLRLQEKLTVLQVALDEWELQKLTGRDLLDWI